MHASVNLNRNITEITELQLILRTGSLKHANNLTTK